MVEDKDSAQALNRYKGMFLPARNAMFCMALIQFAKVFDRDQRTISLHNLVKNAKEKPNDLVPHATTAELDEVESRIVANEAVLVSLKGVRDQRIAHHDAIKSGSKPLFYGDITRLVEDIKSLYNDVQKWHDRSVTSFDFLERDADRHTSEVLRIMREDRDRARQKIKDIEANL